MITGTQTSPSLEPPSSMKAASIAVPVPPWRQEQEGGCAGGEVVGVDGGKAGRGPWRDSSVPFCFLLKTSMKGKGGGNEGEKL